MSLRADGPAITSLLFHLARAFPNLSTLAAFCNQHVTIDSAIEIHQIITASVGVSATDGAIELDLKLPVDLFGLARTAIAAKLIKSSQQWPTWMRLYKNQRGNLGLHVEGFNFTLAGCAGGAVLLEFTLTGG